MVPFSFIAASGKGGHTYRLTLGSTSTQIVVQGPTLNAIDLGPS